MLQMAKNAALNSPNFYRPVVARMYSFGEWALPGETASTVGNAIASIAPTYVSALIRLEGPTSAYYSTGGILTAQMISDFQMVQSIVKATSPGCLFDIQFRSNQFSTGADLAAAVAQALQQLSSAGVDVDVVMFDNFTTSADLASNAVAATHAAGKLVAGPYDPVATPTLAAPDIIFQNDNPGGSPVSIADTGFVVPPNLAGQVASGLPVIMMINNGPTPVDAAGNTEHAQYCQLLTAQQREIFNTSAFMVQKQLGFAWATGLFWPISVVGPPSQAYDAITDGDILSYFQQMSQTYNVLGGYTPPGGTPPAGPNYAPYVVGGIAVAAAVAIAVVAYRRRKR